MLGLVRSCCVTYLRTVRMACLLLSKEGMRLRCQAGFQPSTDFSCMKKNTHRFPCRSELRSLIGPPSADIRRVLEAVPPASPCHQGTASSPFRTSRKSRVRSVSHLPTGGFRILGRSGSGFSFGTAFHFLSRIVEGFERFVDVPVLISFRELPEVENLTATTTFDEAVVPRSAASTVLLCSGPGIGGERRSWSKMLVTDCILSPHSSSSWNRNGAFEDRSFVVESLTFSPVLPISSAGPFIQRPSDSRICMIQSS